MYVDVKDLPPILRDTIRRVSHNKNVEVKIEDSFSAPGSFGKGYRGQVIVVNLTTGEVQYEVGSWGGGNPFEQRPVDEPSGESRLPPGFAALTTGGRYWTLHLNPANVAKVLPAPAGSHEVSLRELWLLWSFRALNSAGRKDEWQRSRSEYRDNPIGGPPSEAELQELDRKGFIKVNRAGAAQITTEGRNLIGRTSDREIVEKAKAAGMTREPPRQSRRSITAEELLAPLGIKPR